MSTRQNTTNNIGVSCNHLLVLNTQKINSKSFLKQCSVLTLIEQHISRK